MHWTERPTHDTSPNQTKPNNVSMRAFGHLKSMLLFFGMAFLPLAASIIKAREVTVPGPEFDDLQEAVTGAAADPTITLIHIMGNTVNWYDVSVTGIVQDLTIDGDNSGTSVIMDAEHFGRHLNINGNTGQITLQHIQFINGSGTDGGSTYVDESDLKITSCYYSNNIATGNGGTLYVHNNSDVEIYYTDVDGSYAANGGAINIYDSSWPNATSGLKLYTCNVVNATSSGAGGVINANSYEIITLDRSNFTNNHAGSTTMGGGVLSAGVTANDISINECTFVGNSAPHNGTCFYVQAGELSIVNSLFADNYNSSTDTQVNNLIRLEHNTWATISEITGSSFCHNILPSQTQPSTLFCIYSAEGTPIVGLIENCNFAYNGYVATGTLPANTVKHTNVVDDFTGWSQSCLSNNTPSSSNHNLGVDPMFVGEAAHDYRIKWNSPLMDAGNPNNLTDFDLTTPDIGWKRIFDPVTLTNNQSDLPEGWYQTPTGSTITVSYSDAVPPGSIFRMGGSSNLSINGSSANGTFNLGNDQSVRTAIVGKTEGFNPTFANALILGCSNDETLEIQGTMLYGYPNQLAFNNCGITLNSNTIAEGLMLYNLPTNFNFNLNMTDCVGDLLSFDFTSAPFPATHVYILRSSVNVRNCEFGMPGSVGYALMMDGHAPGYEMEISDCAFAGGSTTAPSLKLQDTDPRLERNTFTGCRIYPIWSYLGVFGMDHGAKNTLVGDAAFGDLTKLMYLFNSPAYLECGENNFVYLNNDNTGFKFVYYRGAEPAMGQGAPNVKNYTRNFWGNTCSEPVFPAGKIPSWADPGTPLNQCSDQNLQYDPLTCPDVIELEMLLGSGLQAELTGATSQAKTVYTNLIQSYPGTRESYSAALRLKGLGFLDESGDAVTELQGLADAAAAGDSHLGAYLDGAAECVRAWQGDRETAQTNLLALRDSAATENEAIVAQKDLLEIETYPASSGLSTLSGSMLARLLEARGDLQAFDPENPFRVQPRGVDGLRPESIRIERVWPNPFNPAMTLRFHLWHEGPTAVRVYNLRGERVATLHEGVLGAGPHELTWRAGTAASGLYILRVESQDAVAETKVLYLK